MSTRPRSDARDARLAPAKAAAPPARLGETVGEGLQSEQCALVLTPKFAQYQRLGELQLPGNRGRGESAHVGRGGCWSERVAHTDVDDPKKSWLHGHRLVEYDLHRRLELRNRRSEEHTSELQSLRHLVC